MNTFFEFLTISYLEVEYLKVVRVKRVLLAGKYIDTIY